MTTFTCSCCTDKITIHADGTAACSCHIVEVGRRIPADWRDNDIDALRAAMHREHGGRRKGAGRKSAPEPIKQHTVTFLKSDLEFLRGINPSLSQAIRTLIERSRATLR